MRVRLFLSGTSGMLFKPDYAQAIVYTTKEDAQAAAKKTNMGRACKDAHSTGWVVIFWGRRV